ncbi:MAG: DUF4386 domain-containing protein [Gemmatimonadales bacterium]
MSPISIDSPQTTARLAAALWLIVILVSIAAVVGGPSLNLSGSPAETAASVLASETQFRLSFAAIFLGSICYLGVTALLYELLRPVNRSVALFGALAGLCGIALGGAGTVDELGAIALLKDALHAAPATANQLQTIVQVSLRQPEFTISMVFFGCQIASIGYLILRSTFLPRIIGGVLMLGGSSYVITSFAKILTPAIGAQLAPLVIPIAILGEGTLTLWLLIKGVNVEKWREAA